jgi:GGDEF domain-containing protein
MNGTRVISAVEELLSELRRLTEENDLLRQQVRTDRLTGIFNVQALEEYIAGSRYEGYYVFADMDGLGILNKILGHGVVDEYIKEFGLWLRSNTRAARAALPCDAIAIRHHGDEFLVWCSNKKGSAAIRNRIRGWASQDGEVTCSAGMGRELAIADANCSEFKRKRKA